MYKYKFYNIKYINKNKKKILNKIIIIKGWVKFFRNNYFLEINDGSTINNLQVIINNKKFLKKKIRIGIPLKIIGKLIKNKNDIEVYAYKIKMYGNIDKEFINKSILQNKFHSRSKLRQQLNLRFRTNLFNCIIKIRHFLFINIHNYLNLKEFIYINTPIINKNNAEGAGEVFKITTLNLLDKKSKFNCKKDLFKCKANLTVSGQLELESAMYGLGKVYTFGPVFRADNSNTKKHLSEFWMLEPEIMFYKLKDIIKLSVNLIKYLIKGTLKNCKEELNYLDEYNKRYNNCKNLINRLKNIIKKKYIKISYNKTIKLLNNIKRNIINWGDDIGSEHEKILFNIVFPYEIPIIIYNYPKKIKPFYMKLNKDKKTTKSIDILFPYIGEIIGGSERETSYNKLLDRIKKLKINIKNIMWYINLRKLGEIPHSGFGLGFDRLVQYITGMNNIRDIIPYPIYPGHIF
ncbi:MAG: asparagine--tRNA ligase [Candidatus Shikimatogenerans bostrichidophilus]|nr:MAG: asparagine--tRNA ligase [Candidatus Shikimatogenerans bostrichidophilus]